MAGLMWEMISNVWSLTLASISNILFLNFSAWSSKPPTLVINKEAYFSSFIVVGKTIHFLGELSVKLMDDSMAPVYLKGDRVFFRKKETYNTGDDIVIAVKGNVLSVRRLYCSQKMVILQAMNPKYQTITLNVFSEDMILGKVECMSREVK